jgi:transposase-like protein
VPKSPHHESKKDETPAKAGAAVESIPKPAPGKRRVFTAAEKLRIVGEADACRERGAIQGLLRRVGIYSSLLTTWRRQLARHGTEGLGSAKRGRPAKKDAKDRRIDELERKNKRLEAKLELAEKLIELQKKAAVILGIDLHDDEGSS